jgi:hypothetical protein
MMKVQTLPLYSETSPRWKVRVDLSGKRYSLYVSWNTRQEGWSITVMDTDEKILIGGVRLVAGCLLLDKYKASAPELPSGYLMLIDREGKMVTAEPDRDNLAARFALVYITEV